MSLFNKEKELILKITNGILLIWFLAAIVLSFNNAISLLVDKPSKETEIARCKSNCIDEDTAKCDCENAYGYDYDDRYEKISMYTSFANVVVVGSTLYLLNRKKEINKKK